LLEDLFALVRLGLTSQAPFGRGCASVSAVHRGKPGGQVKAIAQTSYGPPDALQCLETPKPSPKDNEVLVQVHASSVNAMDWRPFTFPRFIRRLIGLDLAAD